MPYPALGRVVLYSFGHLYLNWVWVLAVLAALTMTVGNLAALRQTNLKRMLAYSSTAHAGYILVGVAAGTDFWAWRGSRLQRCWGASWQPGCLEGSFASQDNPDRFPQDK
jgi:NADH:ubiquinone oxidoreductase subunit 4 (subunit M)